ncbi:MAG: cation:proton antiporter [Ignavibacteriales bacterium]|nr:cation:proton antiporter [Ignavibacteriales bacterium]
MNVAPVIVFVGILIFLAHLFAGIFRRTKIPDVLFLFIIGLVLGPVLSIVTPDKFGAVGSIFTTITLVIILFEGGISIPFDSIRFAIRGALPLTILNFFATMIAFGFIGVIFSELDLMKSLMLGAMVGGTSSAIVIPLVRQLSMHENSRSILVLESAISDVLCIVVVLGFLEAMRFGELQLGLMIGKMIASFLLAIILGGFGAFVWSLILHKVRTLQNSLFLTPAFVFIVFGIVELLGYSGAISSLAFGFTIANINLVKIPLLKKYISKEPISLNEPEKLFEAEIVFLLKTFFFVYIGLSIQFLNVGWIIFGLLLTIALFALRVPVVKYSISKATPVSDVRLMSVIVPKGLAAAVLASLPFQQGIEGGEFIQNITYIVILFSVIFTSVMIVLINNPAIKKYYNTYFKNFHISSDTNTENSEL